MRAVPSLDRPTMSTEPAAEADAAPQERPGPRLVAPARDTDGVEAADAPPARWGREELWGWAKVPAIEGWTRHGEDLGAITADATISRGLGRAYADSALPPRGCERPVAITPMAIP